MRVFLIAVLLNYVWELAQAPFYVGLERYDLTVFWHCFVASLGDGLMVMVVFAAGWTITHKWDWFKHPGVAGYLMMLSVGLILAALVEWVAVSILGRWAYTAKMPTLPMVKIGLVPLAQMAILPPLIFRIADLSRSKKSLLR